MRNITVHYMNQFSQKFREINFSDTLCEKSTLKRYHDEKNSVKTHNKNLQTLILQMDHFVHSVNLFHEIFFKF